MRIPSSRASLLRLRLSCFDMGWAAATPGLALLIRDPATLSQPNMGVLTYGVVSGVLALAFFAIYRIRAPLPSYFSARDAVTIMKASTAMMLVTVILVFGLTRLDGVPRSTPVIHWLVLVCGLLIARAAGRIFFINRDLVAGNAGPGPEQIIVIGANAISAAYIHLLDACATRGVQVATILDPRPQMLGREIGGVRILGTPDELEAIIDEFNVHGVRIGRVLVAGGADAAGWASLDSLFEFCLGRDIKVDTIPAIAGLSPGPLPSAKELAMEEAIELATADAQFAIRPAPFGAVSSARLKRGIDLLIVVPTLLLLAPLMMLTGFAVLISMGSPVLFWQRRLGRNGAAIHVYKFRTLRAPYTSSGRALSAEERRSTLGDFLRRMHLDELPQLFSVLKGDMSLVGPRPLLPVDQPEASLRLSVPPGLTGWAQLHGGKSITPAQKGTLDDWYVRNWSLLLDFTILGRTLALLLRGGSLDEFRADASKGPALPHTATDKF